jgi:hypothetical protein
MKTRSGVDDVFLIDDSMHLLSPIPSIPVAVQGPVHFIQGFHSQGTRRMSDTNKPPNYFLWLQTKKYPHPGLPLIVCSNTKKFNERWQKVRNDIEILVQSFTKTKKSNKIVQKLHHP